MARKGGARGQSEKGGHLVTSRRGAIGLLLAAAAVPAKAWRSEDPTSAIAQMAEELVRDGHAAGISIGYARPGQAPQIFSFGKADLEAAVDVTPSTSFRIASVTKQFTAAAFMLLLDQGKVALDDALHQYVPGFPGARDVTMYHLLTHTSGISDFPGRVAADVPEDWFDRSDRFKFLARLDPLYNFGPGTMMQYSNSNYLLLGHIIELVARQGYGEFLEEKLFRPAGMTSTVIDYAVPVVPGRAKGYFLERGAPGQFRNAENIYPPFSVGGHRSTAADLLRWLGALHGGRVVSASSYRKMMTPGRVASGALVGDSRYRPPSRRPWQGEHPSHTRSDYAFGTEIAQMFGQRVLQHGGDIPGFQSRVHRVDSTRVDLVLLANTNGGLQEGYETFMRHATAP